MTTADEDRIEVRRAEAVKLRVAGHTIREIAALLGVSVGQAHADVRAAMGEIAKQAEDDVIAERGLELTRLERALRVVEDVLMAPEEEPAEGDDRDDHADLIESSRELKLKALDRLVKIQDQRAKLLGLYAPVKQEHKVAGVSLDELDDLKNSTGFECPPTQNEPDS